MFHECLEIRLKNCSFFTSLISPSKIILFDKKYQAFDAVSSPDERTSKFVKNTPLPVVFSTLFSVFYLVLTHCVECLKHYINKPYNLRMDSQFHRLTKITATDIIIRQKATFAHN